MRDIAGMRDDIHRNKININVKYDILLLNCRLHNEYYKYY